MILAASKKYVPEVLGVFSTEISQNPTSMDLINTKMDSNQILVDRTLTTERMSSNSQMKDIGKSDGIDLAVTNSSNSVLKQTTEPGPSVSSIHQVLMVVVLLGVVILHFVLAVINIVACVKF